MNWKADIERGIASLKKIIRPKEKRLLEIKSEYPPFAVIEVARRYLEYDRGFKRLENKLMADTLE